MLNKMQLEECVIVPQRVSLITLVNPRNDKKSDMPIPDSPNYFRGITLSINVDVPEQVDQVMERAKEAGAKIVSEAHNTFWGGRGGTFFDPENNFWEVAYNPKSKFDERGTMIEMNG